MDKLNILKPTIVCKATDHIKEQIALVATLLSKGYAYDTPEAVYFEVAKFPQYGKLFGQNLEDKKTAAREEVKTGEYKRNPVDFTLWFKRVGRFSDHTMHWESPWGEGFPGWHIECSAMSMKYLGDTIDIHTGGIDHIPVHHPNEIAQSESATGKPFVRFWVHHAFLMVDGKKMSKSLGNYYTIEDVLQKGIDPMALRYFYLTAHYRKLLNFTWEAVEGAGHALADLRSRVTAVSSAHQLTEKGKIFKKQFDEAIANDLNTPKAFAVAWEAAKSSLPAEEKTALLLDFDTVLGLGLDTGVHTKDLKIPADIQRLADDREQLRKEKKFDEADAIRKDIEDKGYIVEDTPRGIRVTSRE